MRAVWIAIALSLWPMVPLAGPLSDVILAPGAFRATAPGKVTRYDIGGDEQLVVQGAEGGAVLALSLEGAGGAKPIAAFPASGANPVLLYFLETVTREVSEATGGSPHYIRNRLRDALGRAGMEGMRDGVRVSVVELRPFAEDPNRARLGPFADLTLRFEIAADAPEQLLSLSAETDGGADGYSTSFTLHAKQD